METLQKPDVLWDKYKESMGEDVCRNASNSLYISREDLQRYVKNEVLLLLQEDLQAMQTFLENFGLPTPQKQKNQIIP